MPTLLRFSGRLKERTTRDTFTGALFYGIVTTVLCIQLSRCGVVERGKTWWGMVRLQLQTAARRALALPGAFFCKTLCKLIGTSDPVSKSLHSQKCFFLTILKNQFVCILLEKLEKEAVIIGLFCSKMTALCPV